MRLEMCFNSCSNRGVKYFGLQPGLIILVFVYMVELMIMNVTCIVQMIVPQNVILIGRILFMK